MNAHRPLLWMIVLLLAIPAFFLAGALITRPQAAPVQPSIWLDTNSAVDVSLPAGSQPRIYAFQASRSQTTRLQLDTDNPDFAFAAEVRNADGDALAVLNGDHLHRAVLLIEPGDELYQVSVAPAVKDKPGTVELTVGEPPAPTPEPPPLLCGVISGVEGGAPVRNGPRAQYDVIGLLEPEGIAVARGIIRGGWYLVEVGGRGGWMSPDSVRLFGSCDQLPRVLDPAIPAAPEDNEPYVLSIDRDGSGVMTQEIAYPNDDTMDVAWLNILNLYDRPPSNYREFTVILYCEGIGIEEVRWGAPASPSHRCGDSITMPFMFDMSQQPLVILLPDGIEQSYVRYTLAAQSMQRAA